jgi:UDP-glucose 4-epimerase
MLRGRVMVNVLVTGGAGYIGSHTTRQFARRGHHVRVYDNLSTGHRFLALARDIATMGGGIGWLSQGASQGVGG